MWTNKGSKNWLPIPFWNMPVKKIIFCYDFVFVMCIVYSNEITINTFYLIFCILFNICIYLSKIWNEMVAQQDGNNKLVFIGRFTANFQILQLYIIYEHILVICTLFICSYYVDTLLFFNYTTPPFIFSAPFLKPIANSLMLIF